MELFAIQNLTFSYPKGGFLLKDLSITISEGEFLLVLGDSGSGKTTFLKQLNKNFSIN